MITFDQFGLKEELVKAVEALGFVSPSPIQAQAIPLLLSKTADITALAQTGTGKTAAFGLPLLHKIDLQNDEVQALILSPTRELCMQIQAELEKYSKFMPKLYSVAVYGGTPIGAQIRDLRRKVQIVVATPGRLIDLIEKGAVNLEHVSTVVLDEADEMLNMGFRDDIDTILNETTAREQTWLFSATMNNDVRRIAKRYMKKPEEIAVAKENVGNENISHQYFVTQAHQRYEVLRRLLDFAPDIYGIIFTRTKQDAQDVSEKLMREGYEVSPLHGDMDQKMRTKVMDRFKKRQLQAIVATDVAARGIDVNDITHVINYELPDDTEVYTHRSGRTARAGKTGICMSIITSREIGKIRQIERIAKSKFEKANIPQAGDIINKRLEHYFSKVENVVVDEKFAAKYQPTIDAQFANLTKDELVQKLVWLQLKDTIASYENATDLNVKTKDRPNVDKMGMDDESRRLFINLGSKDGLTTGKLVQLLSENTDLDGRLFSRITVRELSSFFNVPADASDYITQNLSQQKFNSRRIRIEEADRKPNFKERSGGGDRSFGGGRSGDRNSRSGDQNKRDGYRKKETAYAHVEQSKFSRQKRGQK